MYELKQVGENTYYIESPSKIGIYKINDNDVYLIDSGNDKEAGRKILKILNNNNWNLLGIINTHSNADHIGGNKFLQQRTNCKIICSNIEDSFIKNPILEPSLLYGGYPCKELRNKFLMAEESKPADFIEDFLPEGLEYINLKGHYFNMIGIKTSDNVYFLADSIFGENIINKYHFSFIYDVKQFLETLEYIETLEGTFIPSHAEVTNNIKEIVKINREKILEIIDEIISICTNGMCFEEILKELFDKYELTMNFNQYVLVGSTVKSYLSYLYDEGKISVSFIDNKMLWTTITKEQSY
jgi:glyoxylase-like metal-dependent hydrolase (beta-lactamase superfamily II)